MVIRIYDSKQVKNFCEKCATSFSVKMDNFHRYVYFDHIDNNFELIEDNHYPRQLYAPTNPFEVLSRNRFIKVYHLTKERVSEIIDIVRQYQPILARRSALNV